MIFAILVICLVSLTPFPALPLVIYYYSKFGFIEGFVIVAVASNLKIFIHYYLGSLLRNKKIKIFNLENKISNLKRKYKSIKTKDILLIRLSNLFVTRILNIFLGFINFPLKKTFINPGLITSTLLMIISSINFSLIFSAKIICYVRVKIN